MKHLVKGLVVLVILALSSVAQASPAEPDRIDRLVGLARIWAEVKYFHPAMFQRVIDWDGALIKALPEVEAASDASSYRAAITRLLAAVGDPRTRIVTSEPEAPRPATWKTWANKDVLVLDARLPTNPRDYKATQRLAAELRPELSTAKVVVIDLRGAEDNRLLNAILEDLPATQAWPTYRLVEHHGFRSQGDTNRNTYDTSWQTMSAGAPTRGTRAGPTHVVFVVDPSHDLPTEAVALWLAGHATLMSPRPLDDSALTMDKRVTLPYGIVARLRTGDVILPGGRGLSTDVVTGPGEDARERASAIASSIARGGAAPRGPQRRATWTPHDLVLTDDDDRPLTGLPSRERRTLAAFRVWSAIEYFHGARQLDRDWEQQLRRVLPRLEAVSDATSYRAILEEMLVPLYDGHTQVYALSERGARASTAIYWRRIDGKIVAGGLRDPAEAERAQIALGDELISVDGVPAEELFARMLPTVSSGTEESRRQWTVGILDRGPRGTTVDVEVQSPRGKRHRVTLARVYGYDENFWAHPGPRYRLLPGNIGYADLSRLIGDDVGPMFETFANTRAIVLDMRGYPQGTGWMIGERVNTRAAQVLAEIRTPIVQAWAASIDFTARKLQRARTTDKPLYRGRVVVLIDDRAISAAEHTCLVLEASAGATFIGSPTAGANGEETYQKLPGGLVVRFTGMEILHADGRQLQKVGILPHITVRPTLRGVRAGKDEVLDRALRFIQTGR